MASEIEYSYTGECMKKRIWKRWMAFVLTLMMMAGTMALPVQEPVMAATAHMKKMPVTWDLKNNKTLTYITKWVCGWKNEKVKMTNYKVKNASKKGYKQASFKITYTRNWTPNTDEIEMAVEDLDKVGGYIFSMIVDYKTGKVPSKSKVKMTEKWNWEYEECYTERYWWNFPKSATCKVTITYPKTYKNLCYGVGGSTETTTTSQDTKFFNGKTTFSKTSYYSKKYKNMAHFMRIK